MSLFGLLLRFFILFFYKSSNEWPPWNKIIINLIPELFGLACSFHHCKVVVFIYKLLKLNMGTQWFLQPLCYACFFLFLFLAPFSDFFLVFFGGRGEVLLTERWDHCCWLEARPRTHIDMPTSIIRLLLLMWIFVSNPSYKLSECILIRCMSILSVLCCFTCLCVVLLLHALSPKYISWHWVAANQ